ncbi:hypothetical protein PGT21_035681 [Puccinia graminis f. sp. tritici]|uniref:Uncharacterized protein n=1 Tax=Puccinia graminis f. sp. tritici TaxID=56615 RepID=A0A5B0MR86_PUCGR|nr:hypothetical protein PGT21_035681 [Puccinia graminis f. sp. tritici]
MNELDGVQASSVQEQTTKVIQLKQQAGNEVSLLQSGTDGSVAVAVEQRHLSIYNHSGSVAEAVKQRPQLISEDQTSSATAAKLAPQSISNDRRGLSGGSRIIASIDQRGSNGARWW